MKAFNSIYIKITAGIIAVLLIISLINSRSTIFSIDKIQVKLDDNSEVRFLTEEKILSRIRSINESQTGIIRLGKTQTDKLEQEISGWDYVKKAEISMDISGYLSIEISQDIPLVRLVGASSNSMYLNKKSNLLPLSDSYTSRLTIVTGSGADSLMNQVYLLSDDGIQLFNFLMYISNSPFWSKQIAQVDIDASGYMTLYAQVGKEEIIFGKAINVQSKFSKLRTYYLSILPNAGRNRYKKVNLTVKGQVVCE